MELGMWVERDTVLLVGVGAHASGAGVPWSEVDRRGVYAAPGAAWWGFEVPPTSVPGPEVDRDNWELAEFCRLALRGDPVALEVLATDRIERCTPIGDELRDLRPAFLSQRVADAFRRATAVDFARAAASARTGGSPRHAQVAEVIRLLVIAERLLRTGELDLDVSGRAGLLDAIRAGDVPWPEVASTVEGLRDQTVQAVLHSPLPVEPDQAAVEHWLISVRRRSLDDEV